MSGYTFLNDSWTVTSQDIWYYANFPSGFDTSHSLYTGNNKSRIYATSSGMTKTEVTEPWISTYIYYHWCYALSEVCTANDRYIEASKGYGAGGFYYNQFAAFTSNELYPKPNGYYKANRCVGTISWWWYGGADLPLYGQNRTNYARTCYFKKSENLESSTTISVSNNVSDGTGTAITNVKKYIKYRNV